jgi:hypothetical protein
MRARAREHRVRQNCLALYAIGPLSAATVVAHVISERSCVQTNIRRIPTGASGSPGVSSKGPRPCPARNGRARSRINWDRYLPGPCAVIPETGPGVRGQGRAAGAALPHFRLPAHRKQAKQAGPEQGEADRLRDGRGDAHGSGAAAIRKAIGGIGGEVFGDVGRG